MDSAYGPQHTHEQDSLDSFLYELSPAPELQLAQPSLVSRKRRLATVKCDDCRRDKQKASLHDSYLEDSHIEYSSIVTS